MNYKKLFLFLFWFLCFDFCCSAQDIELRPLGPFSQDDRVLILSPHPDDDAIATGGLIHQLVKSNIPLKIIYLTNGDNNEPAFIVYEKRLVIRQKAVLMMGKLRAKESTNSMGSLGVKSDQLVFLGYPDWGTEDIFKSFWSEKKPFKTGLTRVNKVPYAEALSTGSPYLGDSILNDLKQVLLDFKPTRIFVASQLDSQRDHRAAFLFLQVALWDLKDQIPPYDVYTFLVHAASKWPTPRGFHPELTWLPPKKFENEHMDWFTLPLSREDIIKKKAAIAFFKTQIAYNHAYLVTFVRQNELFCKLPEINLTKSGESALNATGAVIFNKDDNFVYIKLNSDYWAEASTKVQVYLLGYSKKLAFDQMPKIRLDIEEKNTKIFVFEKNNPIFVPEAKVEQSPNSKDLLITFPIKALADPDHLLVSVKAHTPDLQEREGWRVININN
ncbi:MAG: PIG-L family deacetylase [Candidatus Omnitrophica bacterium]|nr:PIG-L family deacetylase [Candidatus Omnitrophota bacterium]